MANKKSASKKPKPTRSETLGLRLDPRLKFALELLSREQRRSISGTVEWCVERALRSEHTEAIDSGEWTFEEMTYRIWDVDPLRQMVNLCAIAPKLATFEELQKYRILTLTSDLWRNPRATKNADNLVDIEDPISVAEAMQEIIDSGKIRGLTDSEILGIPF